MFVGLRRGSLGTWGDWSCAGTSRGAATQPLLSLPLPTLPTNNQRYDHLRAKHWETKHSKRQTVEHLEKKKIF